MLPERHRGATLACHVRDKIGGNLGVRAVLGLATEPFLHRVEPGDRAPRARRVLDEAGDCCAPFTCVRGQHHRGQVTDGLPVDRDVRTSAGSPASIASSSVSGKPLVAARREQQVGLVKRARRGERAERRTRSSRSCLRIRASSFGRSSPLPRCTSRTTNLARSGASASIRRSKPFCGCSRPTRGAVPEPKGD